MKSNIIKVILISAFILAGNSLSFSQTVNTPAPGEKVRKFKLGKNKMYHNSWVDFNKNGKKDVYEDPSADIDDRIEDLLSQMTTDEKTCQMVTLYGYHRILQDDLPQETWKGKLWKDGIGAIDEHLNGFRGWGIPIDNNPNLWPASRHAWAMNEVQRFFVEETRLGIPADFTNEGIRGVEAFRAANFPTQLGIGHTWDRQLVREIGEIEGREARLLGYTNIYAPILDVIRDQRWGRCEESYGEDPFLVAELGVAMTQGLQKDYQVASTAKHFLAYSNNKGAREGMARVDPQISLHEVENIHLYPWREVVSRAGLLGAMVSYNDYDGEPVEGNHYWLTERLRKEFGFKGYLVSDSDAVEYLYSKHHVASDMKEAIYQSVMAGLDVRCTFRTPDSYVIPLRELIEEGRIPIEIIDDHVRNILRVKFMVGLFNDPYQRDYVAADNEVDSPKNNEVALQASRESIVLLKNSGSVLPLDLAVIRKIAVIGPNADETSFASCHYGPLSTEVVSVLEGIKKRVGSNAQVTYSKGCELVDENWPLSEIMPFSISDSEEREIDEAVKVAKESDVAIVVLGGGQRTCGENKSRTSLDLPGHQRDLLMAVKSAGKPLIVILINGRPLSINWTNQNADAILEAWYPGAHGGEALAEVLFGDYNPGGKLTVTFPRTVGEIPFNFPYKPGSQVDGNTKPGINGNQSRINGAIYDFGYGLSYTTFKYSNLKLSSKDLRQNENLTVEFDITNTGGFDGDEIPQLYIHDQVSSITVYERQLRGFDRIHIKAGETAHVIFILEPKDFSMLDRNMKRVIEGGLFDILIGASSTDIRLQDTVSMRNEDGTKPVEGSPSAYSNSMKGKLPAVIGGGGAITFSVRQGTELKSLGIAWGKGTNCRFEISATNGGGQFLPVFTGTAREGREEYVFDALSPSEIRITITDGNAVILRVEDTRLR